MSQEKKKYRLLRPIAMGGRREKGEIVEMTPEEAAGHGPEFVELVKEGSKKPSAPQPEQTGGDEVGAEGEKEAGQPEGEPENAGEGENAGTGEGEPADGQPEGEPERQE